MAKIQDIDIPHLEFAEAAAPGTPAAGIVRIYAKTDGLLYSKDDAGTETVVTGGGGGSSGSVLAHTAITSNVTIAGTTEGGATTIVTGGAITVNGSTDVMVEFFCARVSVDIASAGEGVIFDLYDDATIIGRIAVLLVGSDGDWPVYGRALVTTPANGSQMIVKAWRTAANGASVNASAGGTGAQVPSFVRVTVA